MDVLPSGPVRLDRPSREAPRDTPRVGCVDLILPATSAQAPSTNRGRRGRPPRPRDRCRGEQALALRDPDRDEERRSSGKRAEPATLRTASDPSICSASRAPTVTPAARPAPPEEPGRRPRRSARVGARSSGGSRRSMPDAPDGPWRQALRWSGASCSTIMSRDSLGRSSATQGRRGRSSRSATSTVTSIGGMIGIAVQPCRECGWQLAFTVGRHPRLPFPQRGASLWPSGRMPPRQLSVAIAETPWAAKSTPSKIIHTFL